MKLFAPKYYQSFKCIADKCSHSCCIGWEIDVDKNALEKYESLTHAYGKAVIDSIDYDKTPHFRLCENERCPHLDKKGLCKIITELGEDYLCEICREHPRFYNDTPEGKEVGLGMACQEACRIILESNDYDEMIEIEELEGEAQPFDFDPVSTRKYIYSVLSSQEIPYTDRLVRLYGEFGISPNMLTAEQWKTVISELEYLDESHKELFLSYSSELGSLGAKDIYFERALAYFIYRHTSEAYDEVDFLARLGFCLFCERLLYSLSQGDTDRIKDFARIISEEIEYSTDNTELITEQFENLL